MVADLPHFGPSSLPLLLLVCLVVISGSGYHVKADDDDAAEQLAKDTSNLTSLGELIGDFESRYSAFDPEEFWHPYVYGTGSGNRERLHVKSVNTSEETGRYLQWKYARLGLKQYLVGMQRYEITIFTLDFRVIASLPIKSKEGMETMTVFTKWSETRNKPELLILFATTEPRLYLHAFQNLQIQFIASFPLHYPLKALEFCHIGTSSKVVLIPKKESVDIDIYNIEIQNTTQIWFFQRIPAEQNANVVVYESDVLDSIIAVSSRTSLQVFLYDQKAGLFVSSQDISLPHACRSLFSFTLAYQHYIGCVPEDSHFTVRFVSFNFNKNEYILEEEDSGFKGIHAKSVYPITVPDYTDQYFALVQNNEGKIKIMVYQGRESGFKIEYNCTTRDCPEVEDVSKGVGFRHKDNSIFIFPSSASGENFAILTIEKEIEDSTSPLVDESRTLYNTYNSLSKRFAQWDNNITGIERVLNSSIQTDANNIVSGSWSVREVLTANAQIGNASDTADDFSFVGSIWNKEDFATSLQSVGAALNKFIAEIEQTRLALENAVVIESEFVQHVTARQVVEGRFSAQSLAVGKLVTRSLSTHFHSHDTIDAQHFFDTFLLKTHKLVIKSGLTFDNIADVSNLTTSTIGDIAVGSIARYSEENVFECHIQFPDGLTIFEDLETPHVNGVQLLDEIMTIDNITDLHFEDGFVVGNNTKSKGNFSFDNVLLKGTSQTITSPITFDHLVIPTSIDIIDINGDNFNNFTSSVVTVGYTGIISGRKEFLDKVNTKSLHIASKWNNALFPSGFIKNKQHRVTLNSIPTIETLTTDKANILGTMNKVNVDDFVTRHSAQDLKTTWTFQSSPTVIKDVQVAGLVDGVDMKHLANKATLNDGRDIDIYGDVEFDSDVVINNLEIQEYINEKDFENAFGDILVFNETHCEIPGTTSVHGNLAIDSLSVDSGRLNDIQIGNFFSVSEDQNITGNVVLTGECSFNSLHALRLYDGLNLTTLAFGTLRMSNANTIDWDIHFAHIECDDRIAITGSINNHSDFGENVAVTSGRPLQVFKGSSQFETFTANSADVETNFELKEEQKIGELHVIRWQRDRISLSNPGSGFHRFEVNGSVFAQNGINTNVINTHEIDYLRTKILREGVAEIQFSSGVTFQKGITVEHGKVEFTNSVSGYNLDDFVTNAFPLNSSSSLQLNGIWKFEDIFMATDLEAGGQICGVDLEALAADIIKKDEPQVLFGGHKTFSELRVEKFIQTQSLNDKKTSDLLSLDNDQTIHCPFKVNGSVKVLGALKNDQPINDVPIHDLSKIYSVTPNNTHIIHGDYNFAHNITTDYLRVRGTIQGKDFLDKRNTQHLIRIDDPELKFTGTKTFLSNVTLAKNCTAVEYNGLEQNILRIPTIDEDMTLRSPTTFNGKVEAPSVIVHGSDMTADNVINMNWKEMIDKSIPIAGEGYSSQDLHYLHFHTVVVGGKLHTRLMQGHQFEDFVRLDMEQAIEKLIVESTNITGRKLSIGGMMNGHNIREEYDQTVMKHHTDNVDLSGKKKFLGTLTVLGNVHCLGDEFRSKVIDLSQPFTVPSSVEFLQPITVHKGLHVTGLIDGHTVEDIQEDAWTKGEEPQTITGNWRFAKSITFKDDVGGNGELINLDIPNLLADAKIAVRNAGEKIQGEKEKFIAECSKVHEVTGALIFNPMKLDAFDKHQTLALGKQAEKILTLKAAEKLLLLVSTKGGCDVTRYEWKNNTELFYKDVIGQTPNFGVMKDWQSTVLDDEGLLVFSTETSPCSHLGRGLHFTFLNKEGHFTPVKTIDYDAVTAFRVISDARGRSTAIFAIKHTTLEVFTRNIHASGFSKIEVNINATYNQIEVTLYRSGAAILLSSHTELLILQYNWHRKTFSTIAQEHFLSSNNSPPGIFENYGTLFVFAPQKGTQLAHYKGTSIIQVFSVTNQKLIPLHTMRFADSYQKSIVTFSQLVYVNLLSTTFGLNVYKFQGLSGLQQLNKNPIKIFDGHDVTNFYVKAWDYSAPRPFIAVLTSNTIEIYHSNVYGDSLDHSAQNMCHQ